MSKPNLTVIEGGLSAPTEKRKKYFISSYVTDTRLMGVLAVYIHWKLSDSVGDSDFHQFFYIDCEEMGLETYKSVVGSSIDEITVIEQALVGGLGASKIDISQRQVRGILSHYKVFNQRHDLPFPQGYKEYSFLVEPETILNPNEHKELMQKICGEIVSDYQAVNYFLMRCFGRDYSGAAYLTEGEFPLDLYDEYRRATFCKNVIDKESVGDDGSVSYLCESLIEMDNKYETAISKVCIKDHKVTGFERCSGFAVSTAEAAMMLTKAEFVTVYEVMLSDEDMDNNIGELTVNLNTVMSSHENGRLFMAFKQNNDHVNNRVFRLSNDVKGIYFLTDYGQLIVAAYSLPDIRSLENKLKASPLAPFLMTTAKYEFKEPVLFEFIQSDFEDFDDFLDFIRND
ncbi:MAG: hypothetical protein Q4C25_04710 [Bacillota bacterium]|nr:hypothetical protein [Bacillota bacterium]